MAKRVEPRVLKGFRDYLPENMIPRTRMLDKIRGVFERYGFAPLQTPALEYSEILLGKYGDEGDKLLYRFKDNGDRDVSLRYDLTLPLARVIGQHRNLDKPFKRYQIDNVWRAEKPARGRFREFMQCDVDIVGVTSMLADAECVQVGCDVLKALGVNNFQMRLNNRKILDGLLEKIEIVDEQRKVAVLRTIDKLPKIGLDATEALLMQQDGLSSSQATEVREILDRASFGLHTAVRARLAGTQHGEKGIDELDEVLEILRITGHHKHVAVDFSIARGLDYYTGTIYETFLRDLPQLGSVMSGGRYDNLLSMFSKQPIPAVGISLGIDRLFSGLGDLGLLIQQSSLTQVFVTRFDDSPESTTAAVKLADDLRSGGLRVEISYKAGKLGKQFKAANKRNIPFVVVQGPDERASQEVQLKSMLDGGQETVSRTEIVEWLCKLVAVL